MRPMRKRSCSSPTRRCAAFSSSGGRGFGRIPPELRVHSRYWPCHREGAMERRVAIVTGGLRGLGRGMAFGLAREGHSVLAVGHIDADVAEIEAATTGANFSGQILPLVADLRRPAECDRVVAMAKECFGDLQILVNNAGLTFTTRDPARFRRAEPQKFWQVPDDIVQAVIETNYIAADQMARRVAPGMVEAGWGASSM